MKGGSARRDNEGKSIIRIVCDCSDVDWQKVTTLLRSVGMAYQKPSVHRKAFNNSYAVIFVYVANDLVGMGRAISDGEYQAAIYDVAVSPDYQGQGLGRLIIQNLLSRFPQCNVILYASPGKEDFYRKLGFRRLLTGMALFLRADEMHSRGFVSDD